MTEKELKQLYFLNRETERLQEELRQLEIELEYYDGYKGNLLTHTPKGNGVDMYDKLSEMLDDKRILTDAVRLNLARIQRERAKIEKFIGGIEDAEIRLIFRLRHVNGMTFHDIATEIGIKGYNRESTARKKYHAFLKVSEISD